MIKKKTEMPDKEKWNSLTQEEEKAAAVLGFNSKKWNMDGSAKKNSGVDTDWNDLPQKVKKAGKILGSTESIWNNHPKLIGYNQKLWDEGSDVLPSYDHLNWAQLPSEARDAANCLKCTQHIRDNDGKSPLDEKECEEPTSIEKEAARVRGRGCVVGALV
jgi:hypothetical protein